jgi:hypothetical protein
VRSSTFIPSSGIANILRANSSDIQGAFMFKLWGVCFLFSLSVAALVAQSSNPAAPPNPCVRAEQKQLDFWLGEWDLTWPGDKPGETGHGTNSIRRILDGCVVQESFSGGDSMPLRGTSVSLFDVTGKWKQTWVDNEGSYLDFSGGLDNGFMIFQRESVRRDGTKAMQRMVWKNITANELDWSWESSADGGKTWQVQWPIHYKRKQ